MKKVLNDPFAHADETPERPCAAHPDAWRETGAQGSVCARAQASRPGKGGIFGGGGSRHLPVVSGHIGPGLPQACAILVMADHAATAQAAEAATRGDGGDGGGMVRAVKIAAVTPPPKGRTNPTRACRSRKMRWTRPSTPGADCRRGSGATSKGPDDPGLLALRHMPQGLHEQQRG